ncbi:MAG: TonB-dependent receptor [Opitutus sp.]|nr:TonB-dependent receptor [Opitutus sp.]
MAAISGCWPPNKTSAAGLIYGRGGIFGSLTAKYVGSWTVYDSVTNPDIAGAVVTRSANSMNYVLTDLSVGYSVKLNQRFLRSLKFRLQVSNLFDKKVQVLEGITANRANAYASDTFNVLPTRNYFLTVSSEF